MKVNQISVFAENQSGALADVLVLLGENGIDISAMSVADTTDYGIVRMIVSDSQKAVQLFKENGFAVKCNEVTALSVKNVPGGLAQALTILKNEGIAIEYLYAFVGENNHNARVVMRVSDPEKAEKLFGEDA